MRLPMHMWWGGGVGLFSFFLLAACANSPTNELARAQTDLIRLEEQGADAYLPRQLAAARENVRLARESLQRNSFESAGRFLRSARAVLDSCAATIADLQYRAKVESEVQLSRLQIGLDSLAMVLQAMPKQSYLDQSRYDVHSLKLIRIRQEVAALRLDTERSDYLLALKKGTILERRLRKSLAAVLESSTAPVVTVSNNTSRTSL